MLKEYYVVDHGQAVKDDCFCFIIVLHFQTTPVVLLYGIAEAVLL